MKNRIITDISKIKTGVVYKADYFNEWTRSDSAIVIIRQNNPIIREERLHLLSQKHITPGQSNAHEFGYKNKYEYGGRISLDNYIRAGKIIVYDNIINIKQIEII